MDDEKVIFCPDLEAAFLGFAYDKATGCKRAVYDREKCVQIRIKEGMSPEEAEEFQSYNTDDAYVGPHTPLFLVKEDP